MGLKGDDLNVELNLTSMIDLMSVLVSFLLVTAVWLHISAINSTVESKGKASVASQKPTDNTIEVRVTRGGMRIKWPSMKGKRLAGALGKSAESYDNDGLIELVRTAVERRGDLTASVTGDNNVDYGAVAEAIDAVRAGGVQSVSLATN